MKKLISLIITAMLLVSCLGLTVFANPTAATISDDYQNLTLDGNTYSRFNTSMMNVDYFSIDTPVSLTATQQEIIEEVFLKVNDDSNFVYADIHFKDGAVLSVEFIRDDYLEIYNEISTNQSSEYIIDFQYPDGNTVTTEKNVLYGNSVVLSSAELEWCDYFPVTATSSDGKLTTHKGSLITIDEDYYYVDYEEIDVDNWYDFEPYSYSEIPAYEVTNADLIASIQEAEEAYYSDDFGFLLDDSFTEAVSSVFLIIVFAIIPFAIFVVFLILAIRSKTVYKKLFSIIYILSGVELAIFAIVASFVMFK